MKHRRWRGLRQEFELPGQQQSALEGIAEFKGLGRVERVASGTCISFSPEFIEKNALTVSNLDV